MIDREIRGIEMEERKVKMAIKQAAKKGEISSAKVLAKELVVSKKTKERLHKSKAHLHSVQMTLQSNLATIRVAGCMKKSVEVARRMNALIKVPQLHQTMMLMQREMEKTGLIEEMIDDVMDADDEEVEADANEEVEKVILELTSSLFDNVKTVSQPLPQQQVSKEDEELEARLGALKST